jgi:hypothetical protein
MIPPSSEYKYETGVGKNDTYIVRIRAEIGPSKVP